MTTDTTNTTTDAGEDEQALATAAEDEDGEAEQRTNGEARTAEPETDPLEDRARRLGWRSKEDFEEKGDSVPDVLMTPGEYIDRIYNSTHKNLREHNERLDQMIVGLKKENSDIVSKLGETTELVKSLHEQNKRIGQRAYEKAKRELEAKRAEAVENADTSSFQQIQQEIEDLEANKPAPQTEDKPDATKGVTEPEPEQPQASADVVKFIDDNKSWFRVDAAMTNDAISLHDANLRSGMTEAASLAAVKKKIMRLYPEKFENPRRKEPGTVHTPANESRGADTKKLKFDDLPPEDKQTYERLKGQFSAKNREYTKEQFLEDYQLG